MLSGYQKTRLEEDAILQSLREEGFITTGKNRSAGGLAFEVSCRTSLWWYVVGLEFEMSCNTRLTDESRVGLAFMVSHGQDSQAELAYTRVTSSAVSIHVFVVVGAHAQVWYSVD